MDIMDGMSMDIEKTNKEKLQAVFPECFQDGVLDIDKLLSLCGEFISNDFEKYKFEWKGKTECLQLARKRSTGTLRPVKDESVNFDTTENVYIKGDNLEVLKLLQTAYYRKVKMIYIDPPYNTGNDFVYEDDFADPLSKYKEITQQTTKSNPETMGRFHTNWLNMMYPRLILAANLLRDDGVIFISIGNDELTNLKKLCDEVFGEENCVGTISRMMKSGGNKGQYFSPNMEYILVYAKKLTELAYFREPLSDDTKKTYNHIETEGKRKGEHFTIKGLCQPGLGIRPNQRYWIEAPDGTFLIPRGKNFPSTIADCEKILPTDEDTCWKWTPERYLEEKSKGNIYFQKSTSATALVDEKGKTAKWNVFNKIWLSDREKEGRVPVDLITKWENRISSIELKELGIPFDFAKPVDLIKYLITIIETNKDDIILDFFSGSATTAHAVMQLNAEDGRNRKFICVQLPEVCDEKSEAYKNGYKNICDIGMERIRRAGQKILAEFSDRLENRNEELKGEKIPNSKFITPNCNPDIGFKVFELDTSNLKTWDSTLSFDDYAQGEIIDRMENILSRVKADRSPLDMVYEIMLKIGKPLTESVKAVEIDGKTAYSVGENGNLLICLAKDITPEYLEKLCELKPSKLVVGKDGLASDTAMSNALYICQDRSIELKLI